MNSPARNAYTLIEVLVVLTIIAVVVALAVPSMLSSKMAANEANAVSALRAVATQEVVFKEKDSDKDGLADFASLADLKATNMIDPNLASGTKAGYTFQVEPSSPSPKELYFAIATPVIPGKTGNRYFALNQEGVVYWKTDAPFVLNTTNCTIPAGAKPIGE